MKKLIIIILLIGSTSSWSQINIDSFLVAKIDSIVHNVTDTNNEYILYSVYNHIVIIDSIECKAYYFKVNSKQIEKTKKLSKKEIDAFFDIKKVRIKKNRTNDYYSEKFGIQSYVYFAKFKNNTKTFHFILPFMLNSGKNKISYPYDKNVLGKLHLILLEMSSN